MVNFNPGEVCIGSAHGFIQHISAAGTTLQQIPINDDQGLPIKIFGITFSNDGEMFTCGGPAGGSDYMPNDIVYIPNGTGLVVIIARLDNTAELWHYDLDGNVLDTWVVDTDDGWEGEPLKIDIACDSETVYYSDQLYTIFSFNIATGLQGTPLAQLATNSDYRFNAFKLLPDGGFVVNKTNTGNGPKNAICLNVDKTTTFVDEVNPTDETYSIWKRNISNGAQTLEVPVSFNGINDEVSALGCYYSACAFPGLALYSAAAVQSWERTEFR